VVTHWIVETETSRLVASWCRATLTIVVSKTTARAPTTRISAVLRTFGSSFSFDRVDIASPIRVGLLS
jgi:hypothetical protein